VGYCIQNSTPEHKCGEFDEMFGLRTVFYYRLHSGALAALDAGIPASYFPKSIQ
jgi:hypothetical protein